MPVTLAQAKLMATDDIDTFVIDEFRKSSDILDRMTFDDVVNGAGSGATLTYGYQRQITQRGAAFRAINAEYTPTEVTKQRFTVDLKPLGGSFQIDRVLNAIAAAAETDFQLKELIKGVRAKFADAVINGDTAVDANGFDGLSKILTGSSTEYFPFAGSTSAMIDLTVAANLDSKGDALGIIEHIDAWLSLMDGRPDVIYGNRLALAKFKVIAAWADMIDRDTTDAFGRPVTRYDGIPLVDLGTIAGANTDVIARVTRDVDQTGTTVNTAGLTDLYAVRYGLDAFHGVAMAGQPLVQTWLPDFTIAGAVKTGEAELGPTAPVLKATKSAAVFRNLRVATTN